MNRILVIRQNRTVSTLEKSYNAMKDKKKLEVLIKVIKIIYDKNPGMQEMIDLPMIEVCAEEGVSPEFFCSCLYCQSRNKSKEEY